MKIAIISDIHEDVLNLKKAFNLIEQYKCDEIFSLGDIIGFSNLFYDYESTKNANECVELVRKNCKFAIAGNHDLYIAQRVPYLLRKKNYPANWFQLSNEERQTISEDKIWLYIEEDDPILTAENMDFMKKIPEYQIEKIDNVNYLFSHFIFPDISGASKDFPTKKRHYNQHFEFMSENNCLISFTAHGHTYGFVITSPKKKNHRYLKTKQLKNKVQIINCPAITSSKWKSGFIIFDTQKLEISLIKL